MRGVYLALIATIMVAQMVAAAFRELPSSFQVPPTFQKDTFSAHEYFSPSCGGVTSAPGFLYTAPRTATYRFSNFHPTKSCDGMIMVLRFERSADDFACGQSFGNPSASEPTAQFVNRELFGGETVKIFSGSGDCPDEFVAVSVNFENSQITAAPTSRVRSSEPFSGIIPVDPNIRASYCGSSSSVRSKRGLRFAYYADSRGYHTILPSIPSCASYTTVYLQETSGNSYSTNCVSLRVNEENRVYLYPGYHSFALIVDEYSCSSSVPIPATVEVTEPSTAVPTIVIVAIVVPIFVVILCFIGAWFWCVKKRTSSSGQQRGSCSFWLTGDPVDRTFALYRGVLVCTFFILCIGWGSYWSAGAYLLSWILSIVGIFVRDLAYHKYHLYDTRGHIAVRGERVFRSIFIFCAVFLFLNAIVAIVQAGLTGANTFSPGEYGSSPYPSFDIYQLQYWTTDLGALFGVMFSFGLVSAIVYVILGVIAMNLASILKPLAKCNRSPLLAQGKNDPSSVSSSPNPVASTSLASTAEATPLPATTSMNPAGYQQHVSASPVTSSTEPAGYQHYPNATLVDPAEYKHYPNPAPVDPSGYQHYPMPVPPPIPTRPQLRGDSKKTSENSRDVAVT